MIAHKNVMDQPENYSLYETTLRQLLKQIEQNHSRYTEALSYQRRLIKNISESQQHDTETHRIERAELIAQLDELGLAAVGVSFSKLLELLSKSIGRYINLELLGRGGMGLVFRAHDPALHRDVALKFIHRSDRTITAEWRRRFQREMQAASQLNHPHIITIYDINLEHEPPYVVMELLTGGTLQARLRSKSLPWAETLTLLRPLCQALAYAHQVGVVHRDLKPANIMFSGVEVWSAPQEGLQEILKLVDFGLAYWQEGESITQTGSVIGTLAYMSPEQAREEVVDGRADIFALGIIFFEAIAGHNPLDKGSPIQTLSEVISPEPIDTSPLINKAPAKIIRLIQQAIAKERDRRYPTCETLLADLARCLDTPVAPSFSPPASVLTSRLDIRTTAQIHLTREEEEILQVMFNTFSRIAVEAKFNRGLSGSRVFRIRPIGTGNRVYLPAVVKLAPAGLIHKEWQAYQAWVENSLPQIARLESPPTLLAGNHWGGLRYALVGGGVFKVHSLRDYYGLASAEDLRWVLEERLFKIIGLQWWRVHQVDLAFQMQADYDAVLPINLLINTSADSPTVGKPHLIEPNHLPRSPLATGDQVHLRGFIVTEVKLDQGRLTLNLPPSTEGLVSYRIHLEWTPDISSYQVGDMIDSLSGRVIATRHDLLIEQVKQALGQTFDLSAERLTLSLSQTSLSSLSLPNPLLAYQDFLFAILIANISTIHGDLNLENVLVDSQTREVSLIDFATVRQGHVLHDLLRLETEVVTKLIPEVLALTHLPSETIYILYRQLHFGATQLPHPALEKTWGMLISIRKQAQAYLSNQDDWTEYYQGLILYLLGALKFKNLDRLPEAPLPKQVAFWGAATLTGLLDGSISEPVELLQNRRIDAAAPSYAEVGQYIDLLVQVRFPDSPLFDTENWPTKQKPSLIEQGSEPVALIFPKDQQTGKLSSIRLEIRVVAPDFEIKGAPQQFVEVPSDQDSKLILFLLSAVKEGRCRINVEVYTIDHTYLGTIPVETIIGGMVTAPTIRITNLFLTIMVVGPEAVKTSSITTPTSNNVPEESRRIEDLIKSPEFPLTEPYYPLPEREEDIKTILKTLYDSRGRPVVLVTGLGGIGKTALAVEVVRRCVQNTSLPFQAIAWESAKQELFVDGEIVKVRDAVIAFPDLVDSLGRQLEGPNFIRKPEPDKEPSLKAILQTNPYLVIVDNLETIANAQDILFRLHKLLGRSRALITSRKTVTGDAFQVSLHGLPEGSSITFLREEGRQRNIKRIAEADEDTLRKIYKVTEGMPLAMKLVVSQTEILGLEVTLDNLKKGQGDIYFFIFLESWRLLSDAAKKLLLYVGPTSSAVGREELELALEMTGTLLDKAIEDLVRLSLLNSQFLPGLKQQGYSIHQLTRYFVVNDLPAYWKRQGLI